VSRRLPPVCNPPVQLFPRPDGCAGTISFLLENGANPKRAGQDRRSSTEGRASSARVRWIPCFATDLTFDSKTKADRRLCTSPCKTPAAAAPDRQSQRRAKEKSLPCCSKPGPTRKTAMAGTKPPGSVRRAIGYKLCSSGRMAPRSGGTAARPHSSDVRRAPPHRYRMAQRQASSRCIHFVRGYNRRVASEK
jgi:hypothetical protein